MRRPESRADLPELQRALPDLETKLVYLEAPYVALSASEVRQRVRQGRPFDHLVPAGVAELIRRNGLYR
jgi:nicotinic acid mononucleotide adenylyltransferase